VRDFTEDLKELRLRVEEARRYLRIDETRARLSELEVEVQAPDLWDDQERAKHVGAAYARARDDVAVYDDLAQRLDDAEVLFELAREEGDDSQEPDLDAAVGELTGQLAELELRSLFTGEHDEADAICSINAKDGGVDAQDWAEMLLRMYTRWAEGHGYQVQIVDQSDGDEAGIKSATLEVRGEYAYGHARAEAGVHRLIRLSPFNAAHTRQTSFARVEVMPEVDDAPEVAIKPEDIRMDVFRAGGHGGQGVNTTDSAVRITHIPSGIVVTCQNERSQLQNRETALRVLRGRLLERELQRQHEERARLRGEFREAAFGSQMRTYYLHPSTLVKDHRTDHETSNVQAVLDGQIDPFIEAYLRWNVSEQ
jgi:peptide chain release factor 2